MHKSPTFAATLHRGEDLRAARVEFSVDGHCLIALLRAAELPHASREGVDALAGNYGWPVFTPRLLRLLSGDAGEGVLLDCPCGLPDCWPLAMSVRLQARLVVWEGFNQRRRLGRWDYRLLPPMRFARDAYFEEIARLAAALKKSWRAHARVPVDAESSCAL